jgi:hypothetical protein
MATPLSGQRFGRLLAGEETRVGDKRRLAYHCLCDCGESRVVLKENLTSGRQVSCGCHNKEKAAEHGRTIALSHGMHSTRTYGIWAQMKRRCQTPSNGSYDKYGARGVTVCDRWQKFENFLADMGEAPDGLTLDRIDNERGYEPDNCRWATWHQQALNRRPAGTFSTKE